MFLLDTAATSYFEQHLSVAFDSSEQALVQSPVDSVEHALSIRRDRSIRSETKMLNNTVWEIWFVQRLIDVVIIQKQNVEREQRLIDRA